MKRFLFLSLMISIWLITTTKGHTQTKIDDDQITPSYSGVGAVDSTHCGTLTLARNTTPVCSLFLPPVWLHTYVQDKPTGDDTIQQITFPVTTTCLTNFAGSFANFSAAPADGNYVIGFFVNGSPNGSLTFLTGNRTGTFAFTQTVFAPGDKLTIVTPNADSVASGLDIEILCHL